MLARNHAARPRPKAPPRPVFTFTCNACETVHIQPDPALPDGWAVEELAGVNFCFCPSCAIDLPGAAQ